MPVFEIFGLLALAALAWLWLDSLRARDAALDAARAACVAEAVQLLDATVAIARVGLARDDEGRMRIRRDYEFEFSRTGDDRVRGSLVLLGRHVVVMRLGERPTLHIVH